MQQVWQRTVNTVTKIEILWYIYGGAFHFSYIKLISKKKIMHLADRPGNIDVKTYFFLQPK